MAKPRKQVSRTKKPSQESGAEKSRDSSPATDPSGKNETAAKTGAAAGPRQDFKAKTASEPEEPKTDTSDSSKRGGFIPALAGGILAAFLGFVAGRSDILDPYLPDALKGTDLEQLVTTLGASDARQADDLLVLRAQFEATKPPDLGPVELRLARIETEVQAQIASSKAESDSLWAHLRNLEARLDPVNARLEELEKRPMTESASESAIAAYDRELAALRDAIAAQRRDVQNMMAEARAAEADARELETNAAIAARQAEIQATVARLHTALNSGAPYDRILAEVTDAGITVPEILGASAHDGVASLASLGDAFPKAARAALSASRAAQGNSSGLSGFLQRQLGARSVRPRDGDDPDAILSRAEAALTDGRLAQALEELAALPDNARAQMRGWVDTATTRMTALKAAEELAQSLNTN